MRKTCVMLAATSALFPIAFDWKMDGDKLAVDGDGNPIWVNTGGGEQSVKGDTISNLNAEAKSHRTAKEAAEANLAKYKDGSGKLIDPEAAVKAIETVSKIDAKKLIDAGEVDKVRDAIKAEFTAQLSEKDNALNAANNTINSMRIDGVFKGSEFLANELAVPRDMVEAYFKDRFKITEDGKIEAYDASGNRLLSKKNVGEPATGDEALRLMVDMHPQKDFILKAAPAGGSGNTGGAGSRGNASKITRAEFEAMDPIAQAQTAAKAQKNEIAIVD